MADGIVVGRGWTQPGGRPHAEAMALAQAGEKSRGATLYTTLEPCAHVSVRGPACADLIISARVGRVVVALTDPDERTNGRGVQMLREAKVEVVSGLGAAGAQRAMAGFLARRLLGRPFVTLKLALSLDGSIALPDGSSRWITGEIARRHVHIERARNDVILVGRGTYETDRPQLDVRLPGLADRSPSRALLSSRPGPDDWHGVTTPAEIAGLKGDWLLVEGGAKTAAAFVRADLVDRLMIYRAPILVGGRPGLADIGLEHLDDAHARWVLQDSRTLGSDRLDVYQRVRGSMCLPESLPT